MENGFTTLPKSPSIQESQEEKESVDLSTFLKNTDSQPPSEPRDFQDAQSDKEGEPHTTCGRVMPHADSLVEDSSMFTPRSVRVERNTHGPESSDVLEVQSLHTKASTIRQVVVVMFVVSVVCIERQLSEAQNKS